MIFVEHSEQVVVDEIVSPCMGAYESFFSILWIVDRGMAKSDSALFTYLLGRLLK